MSLGHIATQPRSARNERHVAKTLLVLVQRNLRREICTDAIEEGKAGDFAIDDSLVERAIEGQITLGQFSARQRALGNARIESESDDIVLAARAAFYLERASGLLGEQGKVGQVEAKIEVRRAAGKGTVGSYKRLRIFDLEVLGAEPGFTARQTAGDAGFTGKHLVGGLDAELHAGGVAIQHQIETACQRFNKTIGLEIDRAGKIAPGQRREWCDAGRLDEDIAAIGEVIDRTGQRRAEPIGGDKCLPEIDRGSGLPVAIDLELDHFAQRLGDICSLGSDAGNVAS